MILPWKLMVQQEKRKIALVCISLPYCKHRKKQNAKRKYVFNMKTNVSKEAEHWIKSMYILPWKQYYKRGKKNDKRTHDFTMETHATKKERKLAKVAMRLIMETTITKKKWQQYLWFYRGNKYYKRSNKNDKTYVCIFIATKMGKCMYVIYHGKEFNKIKKTIGK